ncbi:MAG TPA: redoxin domain-containing protein [Pyrinomonadaceae bacterium]|nr:redoxin domain-containing protein [Pyrinomonadaceae bacterium]
MEVVLLFIRIFLFAVFAAAGIGKLLDLQGSEKAVKEFGVPESLARAFAIALPVAELLFALLLLPVSTAWFGAIGAFLLLAVFIGGMIWQMAKGNAPDCHCFGAIHSEPVSKKSLIRNIIFAILAFFLAAQGAAGQGLSFTDLSGEMAIQLILGLATIGLLGAVVFYLKKISEQQTQIMRRIEILELVSHEGGTREVERADAGDPHDSLPIGSIAPDFELPDLSGKLISFEHLLAKTKPLLFFFVSPTCNPCQALLPEIEEWQNELKDKVEFVFLSSGKAAENAEKFGGTSFKNILLQEDKEVSALFHAKWTPTAIFINSDGIVASHLSVGDEGIRDLVKKVKSIDFDQPAVFIANGSATKLGEDVPEFAMPDVYGREITSKDFQGKKTLVTFWSTTCPHCLNMIRDLQEWDKEKGADEPNLIVFSQGDAEDHKEFGLKSPILIDEGYKTSEKFGMYGTPSAVLVNEKGKIISETAVGASNIWALIGKRK